MARVALMQPKNFAPDSGGSKFKEGFVRVDNSVYTIHQDPPFGSEKARDRYTALRFDVTRLTDDLEPMVEGEDDTPVVEKLYFSFGGKSLGQIHPANGSGPDDEEPEDCGDEMDVEGNTVTLIKDDFRLNPKSGLANLSKSLSGVGYTPEHMARMWAPDFKGVIFHMKSFLSEDKMKGSDGVERPIAYKVVDKFFPAKGGAAGKGSGKAAGTPKKDAGKEAGSTSGSKTNEAEKLLDPILMKLSDDFDGQSITRKALGAKVSAALQAADVPTKMHIPILTLVKDNDWLTKNGGKYDFVFDAEAGTIQFGSPSEPAA